MASLPPNKKRRRVSEVLPEDGDIQWSATTQDRNVIMESGESNHSNQSQASISISGLGELENSLRETLSESNNDNVGDEEINIFECDFSAEHQTTSVRTDETSRVYDEMKRAEQDLIASHKFESIEVDCNVGQQRTPVGTVEKSKENDEIKRAEANLIAIYKFDLNEGDCSNGHQRATVRPLEKAEECDEVKRAEQNLKDNYKFDGNNIHDSSATYDYVETSCSDHDVTSINESFSQGNCTVQDVPNQHEVKRAEQNLKDNYNFDGNNIHDSSATYDYVETSCSDHDVTSINESFSQGNCTVQDVTNLLDSYSQVTSTSLQKVTSELTEEEIIFLNDSDENLHDHIKNVLEENVTIRFKCDGDSEDIPQVAEEGSDEEELGSGDMNYDRETLLAGLRGNDSMEEAKQCSSTPVKVMPPSVSSIGLPVSPISIVPCEDLSETSESETDDNTSGNQEEGSSNEEESVAEGFVLTLPEGCFGEPQDSSSDDNNVEVPESEPEYAQVLTKAAVFSSEKIYSGSHVSVNEAILQIMTLYVKNKQSKSGLERAIKTICNLLPEDHAIPTSSFVILDYIKSLAPKVPAILHYYCEDCLFYCGTSIVGNCVVCRTETKFGHFYCFDVAALIKFYFENSNLASILEAEDTKSKNVTGFTCLKDGSVFKSLNKNRNKYDLNLTFNSDGVRIRKSSTKELWLAMVTFAELPIHLQKSFLSVVGVWYDKKKPDMKTFLKPFVDRMELLDQGDQSGVTWTHPTTGEEHRSRVLLLVTVLDAPARSMVQNLMNFNSRYGCNLCEIKTQLTAPIPGKKRVRRYQYQHNPKLRTKERMMKQAVEVGEREHFKGVRGPSVLSVIPSVDVSQVIVPEYLHSSLLGVCKQLLKIWTSISGPWSIKTKIPQLDNFLKTFKHPTFVHRSIRQLKSLKYWKASDFYYFLLFESLPTLKGSLPDVYLQHFMCFIIGIFKLLKTDVTEADLHDADLLLRLFVIDFGPLYGDRQLTSNVHQMTHLALCVRRFGPLHCFSAFIYEDLNGLIARKTHGTNNVDVEIVNNVKICQGINVLQNIVNKPDYTVMKSSFSEGELLGKEVKTLHLLNDFQTLYDGNPAKVFSRAKMGHDIFTSEIHKSTQSENCYIMWSENGCPKFGLIKYFAKINDENFVVIRLFVVDHTEVFYHQDSLKTVEHFIPVQTSDRSLVKKFSDIVQSIVKVGKVGSYLYKRPNLYRYVL